MVVKKKKDDKEMKISDLPGVGPAACEKLEAAGIFDLIGVAVMGPKELSETAGLSRPIVSKYTDLIMGDDEKKLAIAQVVRCAGQAVLTGVPR